MTSWYVKGISLSFSLGFSKGATCSKSTSRTNDRTWANVASSAAYRGAGFSRQGTKNKKHGGEGNQGQMESETTESKNIKKIKSKYCKSNMAKYNERQNIWQNAIQRDASKELTIVSSQKRGKSTWTCLGSSRYYPARLLMPWSCVAAVDKNLMSIRIINYIYIYIHILDSA